jgi:hypothetical protein
VLDGVQEGTPAIKPARWEDRGKYET